MLFVKKTGRFSIVKKVLEPILAIKFIEMEGMKFYLTAYILILFDKLLFLDELEWRVLPNDLWF